MGKRSKPQTWRDIWPKLSLQERADLRAKMDTLITDREWAFMGKTALKNWAKVFVVGFIVGALIF